MKKQFLRLFGVLFFASVQNGFAQSPYSDLTTIPSPSENPDYQILRLPLSAETQNLASFAFSTDMRYIAVIQDSGKISVYGTKDTDYGKLVDTWNFKIPQGHEIQRIFWKEDDTQICVAFDQENEQTNARIIYKCRQWLEGKDLPEFKKLPTPFQEDKGSINTFESLKDPTDFAIIPSTQDHTIEVRLDNARARHGTNFSNDKTKSAGTEKNIYVKKDGKEITISAPDAHALFLLDEGTKVGVFLKHGNEIQIWDANTGQALFSHQLSENQRFYRSLQTSKQFLVWTTKPAACPHKDKEKFCYAANDYELQFFDIEKKELHGFARFVAQTNLNNYTTADKDKDYGLSETEMPFLNTNSDPLWTWLPGQKHALLVVPWERLKRDQSSTSRGTSQYQTFLLGIENFSLRLVDHGILHGGFGQVVSSRITTRWYAGQNVLVVLPKTQIPVLWNLKMAQPISILNWRTKDTKPSTEEPFVYHAIDPENNQWFSLIVGKECTPSNKNAPSNFSCKQIIDLHTWLLPKF